MRRLLWACFALGALWAIYRTSLAPKGSQVDAPALAPDDKESAAHQIFYQLAADRPLVLMIGPGASHVRIVTVFDLRAAEWTDSDREYAYSYRATFSSAEGRRLLRADFSESTRKIRLPAPGGTRENVSYGAEDVLACEPRSTILDVPAGASRLELEWTGARGSSGTVRALEKVASEADLGTLYRRWESLSPEARERLGRASALGTADPTLREKIAALAHPWKRLVPLGNPGRDYFSRYLYVSQTPVEYVPPAKRTQAAAGPASSAARPAPPAVWNLIGPGEVELVCRAAGPPLAPVRLVREDGFQQRLLVPVIGGAGERRGRFAIGPGLQTLELELPAPGVAGAGFVVRTRAREATPYSTGPSTPPTLPVELPPASMSLRSWRTGPPTSAVNPELEVVLPPDGSPAILRVSARAPAASGALPLLEMGLDLLDGRGSVIARSVARLATVSSPDDRPRSAFGPSESTMGIATFVVLLDRGVNRVRFWSRPESALCFYTQLDDALDVRPDRRARDRRVGIVRWAQEDGRRWHALRPSNVAELEREQRLLDIATAVRAVTVDASPRSTPPADWEATPLAPGEPLLAARVLEPVAPSPRAGAAADAGLLWPFPPATRTRVSRRHARFPQLEVPFRGRLLWQAATPPRTATPLQLRIGGILVASVRPATRAGDVSFEGAPALPAFAELTGRDPEGRYFLSLPPAAPATLPAWRERSYSVMRSGDSMTLEVLKEPGRDAVVNLAVAPLRDGRGGSLLLTATLEGAPPRAREIFGRMTQPRQTLSFTDTGESQAVLLDERAAELSGVETAFLTVAEDRPPGRYRWKVRVARGKGALVRAFVMRPVDTREGLAWLTSRM